MYLPILTLRTSGIPKCRIASRTAFPCGSSTAAFGITITLAFIPAHYFWGATATSAIESPSFQDDNFESTIPAKDIHAHIAFVVSREQKVNAWVADFEIANAHPGQELRQELLREYDLSFRSTYIGYQLATRQNAELCCRASKQ
jgi:hypothetical protein